MKKILVFAMAMLFCMAFSQNAWAKSDIGLTRLGFDAGIVDVDGGGSTLGLGVTMDMGADITVAVNVVPPMKRGVETVLSSFYRRINVFNPMSYLGDGQDMPNLFDIVMNSLQILQYELGNFKAISADVLINPDLSDFTWIEYYRADELIERGVDAARKALPLIQKAIQAKIDPIRLAAPGVAEKSTA